MPKAKCPKCGTETPFAEGMEEVYCMLCDYKMKVTYKIEKIEGDPVSYLLKRAEEPTIEVGCPNCHVLCVLEYKNKRPDGFYKDVCWSCSQPLPMIRVALNNRQES